MKSFFSSASSLSCFKDNENRGTSEVSAKSTLSHFMCVPPDHHNSNDSVADSPSRARPIPNFSRSCAICFVDDPCERCFFKNCGHIICRVCAIIMTMETTMDPSLICPFCRMKSKVVTLKENPDKDYDEFLRNLQKNLREELSHILKHQSDSNQLEAREYLALTHLNGEIDFENYIRLFSLNLQNEAEALGMAPFEVEFCRTFASVVLRGIIDSQLHSFIEHLKNENIKSPPEISRTCFACTSKMPLTRSVFTKCGHIICGECAAKIEEKEQSCPKCTKKSKLIHLYEDLIE